MGGLFSKPKSVKAPVVQADQPPAIEETGAGDAEKKRLRRRSSRKDTFLTGELTPDTGKKKVLG